MFIIRNINYCRKHRHYFENDILKKTRNKKQTKIPTQRNIHQYKQFFHQRKKSIALLFHPSCYWHNQNSIPSIGRNFQHENSAPFNDPFLVLKLHC